jgi:hypothetical protein
MSIPELQALARNHWEKWLPEKVKELRLEGKLEEALHGAASLAQKQIDHLTRDRGYPEWAARERALPQFILLKPEEAAKETFEEREEAVRAEREYRKNPPPT